MELRAYQTDLIRESREAFSRYKHIIVQSPTGSGKGVLIGSMASMSVAKHNRVLILAHSEEILKQDAGHARKWGVKVAEVFAKTRKMPEEDCCCMMAQTLRQRLKKDEWARWFDYFGFIILDECHRAEFDFVFEQPAMDCRFVVGLSASPARYGQMRQLGLDYEAIVVGPSVKSLIDQHYLCRCRLFSLDAPSMDDVEWSYARGDYNLSQMAGKFKSRARYVGAVDNYERLCKGQKCLVFCCSSEQTIELTKEFCERGIEAKYCLSGDFDEDDEYSGERKDVVDAFARGDFPVLVNYGLFTTGIDIPDIKVVMLMFSTTSLVKYMQVLGRGSRMADGKNGEFICLDFGRNYERLGRYEDDREWSVWHNAGAGGGVPPTKECKGCGRLVPVSWKECAFCGYVWPTQQDIYNAELNEIIAREDEESLESYVAKKKLEGKSNNWILIQVCIKNPDNQKEAFMRAIEVLRTKHGANISPKFWFFFKKEILSKVKVKKKDDSPSLFK
ncbi:MAG: DEAD/DEAH box helicase family protein [Bacteroidales bacterium]|nr:DEAD/DEAH box helicase family protein [Bacteroidales bacterium]